MPRALTGSDQVLANELERTDARLPIMFEREDTFFSQIEKRPVEVVNERSMVIPLELRPGGKSGHFSSNGGDMGRGSMPTYDKATIGTVELIHRIEWTTRRKWATDSKRKAIVDAFRRDLASSMDEFRRYIDCLCMTGGDGVLGTISAVDTAAGVDTLTMDSDGFGARLLRYNQDIRVFNAALTTDRNEADGDVDSTIASIDYPSKQITIPSVAGTIVTDKIVAQGLVSTPPVSLLGVPYHYSSASVGTWLGFDRSLVPEIRANRVNANGSALTLPIPRLAINKIGDRIGLESAKSKGRTIWCHPCQRAAYEELGFEAIQINKSAKDEGLDLYFSDNMRIAGMPMKNSYSWNKKRMDLIDLSIWGRAEMHGIGWYKDDNGNRYFVIRGTSGGVATSNVAYIVVSFNTYINKPPAASYIDNLGIPSGY